MLMPAVNRACDQVGIICKGNWPVNDHSSKCILLQWVRLAKVLHYIKCAALEMSAKSSSADT